MASWEGAARRCDRPGGRRGLREVSEGAGRPVESPPPGVSGRGPLGPPSRTPTGPAGRGPPAPPGPLCSHTRAPGRVRGGGGRKPPPRTLHESLNGKRSPPSLAQELRGWSSRFGSALLPGGRGAAAPWGERPEEQPPDSPREVPAPRVHLLSSRPAAVSERLCRVPKTSCWIERDPFSLFPDSSGRFGEGKK